MLVTVICNNCKKELTITNAEPDTKIWVDSYSCDCEIDCGYDDRSSNHSHIWISPKGVAEYCKELQAEIQALKDLVRHEKYAAEVARDQSRMAREAPC